LEKSPKDALINEKSPNLKIVRKGPMRDRDQENIPSATEKDLHVFSLAASLIRIRRPLAIFFRSNDLGVHTI